MSTKAFSGPLAFCSNFHPCSFFWNGRTWKSVEHAYQAAKTFDPHMRETIASANTPAEAKRLARKAVLRHDWSDVKLSIMEELLRLKFARGSDLAQQLLNTGDQELVEVNWWNDTFWGVCNGRGANHLGKLLMKIREELK